MKDQRNRLVVPRNIVNTKMLYTFYILKELSKGEVIFGNKILSAFRDAFEECSHETLYSLEEKGYVVSSWTGDTVLNKRSKKVYSITDEGLYYYKTHIADYVNNIEKTKSTLDLIIKMLN